MKKIVLGKFLGGVRNKSVHFDGKVSGHNCICNVL